MNLTLPRTCVVLRISSPSSWVEKRPPLSEAGMAASGKRSELNLYILKYYCTSFHVPAAPVHDAMRRSLVRNAKMAGLTPTQVLYRSLQARGT